MQPNQFRRQRRLPSQDAFGPAAFDHDVLSLNPAQVAQALIEACIASMSQLGQFRTLSVGLDQDVREPARSPGTRITSWTN